MYENIELELDKDYLVVFFGETWDNHSEIGQFRVKKCLYADKRSDNDDYGLTFLDCGTDMFWTLLSTGGLNYDGIILDTGD